MGELRVLTAGSANFGGTMDAGGLDVDADRGSTLAGDITTSGDQRYRDGITVAAALRELTLPAGLPGSAAQAGDMLALAQALALPSTWRERPGAPARKL